MSDEESNAESDVDLWWLEPPDSPLKRSSYIELGMIVIAEDAGAEIDIDLEDCEPIERVTGLMRLGDQVVYASGSGEDWFYGLAVESVLDPHVQLELGCLLLQRANVDESPLCEHLYPSEDFVDWNPHTEIHEELWSGPPSANRVETVRLALRAYGNAFLYYKWGHAGSLHYLFRTLLALDGMRVCYSELEDHTSLWKLCSGLGPWLKEYLYFMFGAKGTEVDEFVTDVKERFAGTRGELKPMMVGMEKAQKRLERELSEYWDYLPLRVREHLKTAEYKRANLKDPEYDPWDIGHNYCLAAEEMLNYRVGRQLDSYLDSAPPDDTATFQKNFLKDGRWKARNSTVTHWEKWFREPEFRGTLAKAGLDVSQLLYDLPKRLTHFLPYRTRADHASVSPAKDVDPDELRDMVSSPRTGILAMLSRTWPQLPD